MYKKRDLTKKSENISDWYNDVVYQADLADYGPSKGTMIIKPYGYAIWELVQAEMDKRFKERGIENCYFPMFIPESFLKKEKDHLEGFSPELAVVTIGGGKELEEKLVVRPTSETIMYDAYSRWISSWRDLPVMYNQWNSAVRWEKRTYLFLRTTEFLWQEGHTAHATHKEAWETVLWAMDIYKEIYEKLYAVPGYVGTKSRSETFAGADTTVTFESLMPSGKALQACTSHDLGQHFSKADVFNVSFQDKNGETQYVWQTSFGFSTRSLGGLFMAHGDDNGLRLPPRVAPIQVVILPVKPEDEQILGYSKEIEKYLKEQGVRVKVDSRDDESFGFRINKWELKGVPIRIEVGKKEAENNEVTLAFRYDGTKKTVSVDDLQNIQTILQEIQDKMFADAKEFLAKNTFEANTYDEFKEIMKTTKGFIKAYWCEDEDVAKKVKEETTATVRCLPLDANDEPGICIFSGKPAKNKWIFAQSY